MLTKTGLLQLIKNEEMKVQLYNKKIRESVEKELKIPEYLLEYLSIHESRVLSLVYVLNNDDESVPNLKSEEEF